MTHSLMNLTGHEAGLVVFDDETVIIANWNNIVGIPHTDPFGICLLGLAEKFDVDLQPAEVPAEEVLERFASGQWEVAYAEHLEEDINAIVEAAQEGDCALAYQVADDVTVYVFQDWN